jgi:hypothetical protein
MAKSAQGSKQDRVRDALLATDDPLYATAHEVGDLHQRLDAFSKRIGELEHALAEHIAIERKESQ